jgi:D-alanyl-D-alanine carboxypeptidase
MTDLGVLQEGRQRRSARQARARRARRRRRIGGAVTVLAAFLVVLLVFMAPKATEPGSGLSRAIGGAATATAAAPRPVHHAGYAVSLADHTIHVRFALLPRGGLLFDVRTGRVLWQHAATLALPIASLTKMMTALVVVAHSSPNDQVLITPEAVHFSGSGVGLLPLGKRVSLESLMFGLLLPSGNDAAIALAQHVAGSVSAFIALMNDRARQMGLRCTHFNSVSGIVDQDNYSCASDLAILAHAVLEQPLLARIVASRSAILRFPIKGGKVYLYNNNPLMYLGYPGVDGVKTGYTVAAGSCLVAAAQRGRAWYGVVLLHSVNPPGQAEKLLNAAFGGGR